MEIIFSENLYGVVVTIGLAFVLYVLIRKYASRREYKLPPGPKGMPLIGYTGDLSWPGLWDHKDHYGDISYVNVFGSHIVILNSIDAMRKTFINTAGRFDNRPNSFVGTNVVVDDIAFQSPTASHWKELRQLMHSKLKAYGRGINVIEEVIKDELLHLKSSLMDNRDSIDLHDVLEPCVCNITYILIAGVRFPYDHPMILKTLEYLENFNYLGTPSMDTILTLVPFVLRLPFGIGKLVKHTLSLRDTIIDLLLEPYVNLSLDELKERKGIVFELLTEQKNCNGRFDTNHVKGCIHDIMGAGINTTTCSMYHFFLIICHYPQIQSRIQSEIDDVVAGGRLPSISDRANMPYTSAVILELLRYGTVLPLSLPHASACAAELGTFTLPKDTIIIPNQFRVNHDPDVWKYPWSFDPTRFLDNEGSLLPALHPTRRNVITFGLGNRLCIGEVFAKTRIFLIITHLLQMFNFRPDGELPSCDPRDLVNGFIIRPSRYRVTVEIRDV